MMIADARQVAAFTLSWKVSVVTSGSGQLSDASRMLIAFLFRTQRKQSFHTAVVIEIDG